MDVATRYQPRIRAQYFLDRERNAMPDDSGGESSESATSRKFQRTVPDSDSNPFRKSSLPASASRPGGLEHRPSFSSRRRGTLRENVRVPSGPREFPSPGKRLGSTSSINPPLSTLGESTNTAHRSFLSQSNSDAFLSNSKTSAFGNADNGSFSFGNHNQQSSTDHTDSPTTPAERASGGFDFVPTMTFDDFQNSITDPNWTSPLLSEFPTHSGGRALPKDTTESGMPRSGGFMTRPGLLRMEDTAGDDGSAVGRTPSFRRRIKAMPASRNASGQTPSLTSQPQTSVSQPNLSLRTRRQSTMPQGSAAPTQPVAGAGSRPPRKSVGPGVLTTMMEGRKASSLHQQPATLMESSSKPVMSRTSSLTSKARRTTLGPEASAGAEASKGSTLTATTQSRANKVKSLQAPPRQHNQDPDTPGSGKHASRGNQGGAHTPSSSGNKRQSTASGRASGLGARTISPTDARRLKRISMMQPPPMPTGPAKGPPTPQEEFQHNSWAKPELPRLTQPSPSLIPRKMSTGTPTSARASPENRFYRFPSTTPIGGGGVPLSAKSSYQSLLSQTGSGSTSRLPTPKPRSVHSSNARYDESGHELVPPVPAIPKAYESPKEQHEQPFFSSSLKSSHSMLLEPTMDGLDFSVAGNMLPTPVQASVTDLTPRGSMDLPPSMLQETPRKRSGEHPRAKHQHKRSTTVANASLAALGKTTRPQPDSTGHKNGNLQPLRLPPFNLQPINTPMTNKIAGLPHPSMEVEGRDGYASVQTPEPKRTAKTPSTPMTASKATFFRRQDESLPAKLRSSTSHYALRDLQMDHEANGTRFFDDSDAETPMTAGVPIANAKQRSAITPFSSGSLPKHSGEFARLRGRPSGEYNDDYDLGTYESMILHSAKPQGPRPKTSGTTFSVELVGTPSSTDRPLAEQAPQQVETKKESSGGGLRRKLSLGWRRSSSKAARHPENKSSPQQQQQQQQQQALGSASEKEKAVKLQKRQSEMPPPKLPASASAQWSTDAGLSGTASVRSSLETGRRKSTMPPHLNGHTTTNGEAEQHAATGGAKTRALHSEQPQPVPPAATRSSSWAASTFSSSHNNGAQRAGLIGKPSVVPARHKLTASTISAIVKDKDDLAADDEMRRLSQKRKDVDAAACESEALKTRAVARTPVAPAKVLQDRNAALNIFERGEVVDYEKDGIYFTGTKGAKKVIGSLSRSPTLDGKDAKAGNYGYDDERGDYNIVLGDHLAYRYEVVDVLGKGSFGQVVRCVDHKSGDVVAVKIIRNKKRFHQQALVEVEILGRLGEWDPDGSHATLSITTSFYFRSHLCIVTPCLSINLYEFIRAHNFTGFSLPLIRRFSRQLLACLVLLQSKRIIHCDLKPENILLCEARKADVRVIDFGSSCREEEKVYTYIQSRFYRSPEVILGSSYGLGIDVWSLGCILAELWTGYPLFPGENEQEQLACIMEIFGPPDRHLVERCTRKKLFFDSMGKPRVTVSSKGRRRRPSSKTLQQALKTEDEAFVDFVARCLRWDPERRMKPSEAVGHPFVTGLGFHPRPGIPEEARRAARVRSSAAVPATATTNGTSIPSSPVKRNAAKEGNAFAQAATATPAKERRALPETPQTALRSGTDNSSAAQGSPSKVMVGNRRHSTVATAGAAADAGRKRASNGAVLGHAAGVPGLTDQRLGTGNVGAAGNLAQMAARESMGGATAAGQGSTRWRS